MIRNGSDVVVTKGHLEGQKGKVVRTCPVAGYRWVTLSKFRKDPVYCDYQFGPFVDNELAKRGVI